MTRHLTRIAYVEDDPDIREITVMALGTLGGYEVADYASGADAIRHIADFRPDLILTDVMMPGMSGPELIEQLSGIEEIKGTPVVFMTAKTSLKEFDAYKALGLVGVVTKPYDPLTLPDELRRIWNAARGVALP